MNEVVRVLLVEDHVVVRELFAAAFDREPDFEVVAQAGSLAEARGSLEGVDVAVLDFRLPDGQGTEIIAELRANNPHGAALVLTANQDLGTYARAVRAGASGVFHKSIKLGEVMDAVRRVVAGEALLSQKESVELLRIADREHAKGHEARACFERLTSRERDALRALSEGMNDKEIAARLGVGVGTARAHVAGILTKFGAHSRLQALVFAASHGFVKIGNQAPQ